MTTLEDAIREALIDRGVGLPDLADVAFVAAQAAEAHATRPVPVERRHPLPGNVLLHVQDMGCEQSADLEERLADGVLETRTPTTNLDAAMLLTSSTGRRDSPPPWLTEEQLEAEALHRPVLDLDMPVTLVPSSTEGHHHLLIDRPVTWSKYVAILDALADAGLLEVGYVEASKRRGCTAVRVPWFRKGDIAPDLDGNRVEPHDLAPADGADLHSWEMPA